MKYLFGIIALCAVVLGGWYMFVGRAATGNGEDNADVKLSAVELREQILETVRASGEVAPAVSTEVKAEVSGKISSLNVDDGDSVTNGQVLLELDRSELLSEEEEMLRMIESSRLRSDRAIRDFERQKGLHEKGFVTQKAFEDAQTDADLAQNDFEIQEARLQTLREKLSKTTIKAPHDGRVLDCDLTEGQVIVGANSVSQGSVLMKIADLNQLIVKIDINEVDVTRLTPGMTAQVTFDSVPDMELEGALDRISPSAKLRERLRVFPVEITCKADDVRIKPGISATVSLTLNEVTSVVGAVVSSVFTTDGETYVYRKTGDDFEKQIVETGINDAKFVEITSGLKVGDDVAMTRPPAFKEE